MRLPRFDKTSPFDRMVLAVAGIVAASLALALLVIAWRLAAGDGFKPAVKSSSISEGRFLFKDGWMDSLGPMAAAKNRLAAHPDEPLYANVLGLDNCKFQYPPSSLLLLELLPLPTQAQVMCGENEDMRVFYEEPWKPIKQALDWLARLALLATIGVSLLILQRFAEPLQGTPAERLQRRAALFAVLLAAGLISYPLIWGIRLGQIQIYLNLLASLAVYAHLVGRSAWAGVAMGLCCLVKPQYAVLLVWAALRRDLPFATGLAAVAASGFVLAVARYGVDVHLEYVAFLRGLARYGESFWANQSANGLMSRWLGTGHAEQWADSAFAPSSLPTWDPAAIRFPWEHAGFPAFHPAVYGTTLVTSLLALALALMGKPKHGSAANRTLDFAAILAACTIASPIAWQHHYGAFFPLFALAVGVLLSARHLATAALAALAIGYLLVNNAVLRPELVFADRRWGLLGSHLWFGALLFFGLLLWMRGRRFRLPAFDRAGPAANPSPPTRAARPALP